MEELNLNLTVPQKLPPKTHVEALREFLTLTEMPPEAIKGIVQSLSKPSIPNFWIQRGDIHEVLSGLSTNEMTKQKFKHAVGFIQAMLTTPDPTNRSTTLQLDDKNPVQLTKIFHADAYEAYWNYCYEEI